MSDRAVEAMSQMLQCVFERPRMFADEPHELESFLRGLMIGYEIAADLPVGTTNEVLRKYLADHSPHTNNMVVHFHDKPNDLPRAIMERHRDANTVLYGDNNREKRIAYDRVLACMHLAWTKLKEEPRG